MADLSLVLFDDSPARLWEPFALTRPAGELVYGALTLRERAELVFGARCVAHLAADHLLGFEEDGAPTVCTTADVPTAGDRLFWLSRAAPDWNVRHSWRRPASAGPVTLGGRGVGWYAPDGSPPPSEEWLLDPGAAPAPASVREVQGRVIERVWELIGAGCDQIGPDILALNPGAATPALDPGVFQWGEHPLVVGEGVRIEPGATFDTTGGPIWLDRGVVVRAFTRLCGPSYIGPDSIVLGGTIGPVSAGPVCRIRGEIAEAVCLGYTNKQHDGHLGHAYLGRWVNLGAGTTNSDLKNNYSNIRLWTPEGDVDTGEIKMGCLLGDHVKTGIGLLINTGTVVGAGSNLWGALLPPKYVPPFSWGSGEDLTEFRLDKFLEVAERAMARRDVELTEAGQAQLRRAWERARGAAGT